MESSILDPHIIADRQRDVALPAAVARFFLVHCNQPVSEQFWTVESETSVTSPLSEMPVTELCVCKVFGDS